MIRRQEWQKGYRVLSSGSSRVIPEWRLRGLSPIGSLEAMTSGGRLLFALGLVLSSATQLRVPGLPIGAGEVLLGAWIGLASINLLLRGRIARTTTAVAAWSFWLLLLLCITAGGIMGLRAGMWVDSVAFRTIFALVFDAALIGLLVSLPAWQVWVRRASDLVLLVGGSVMLILAIAATQITAIGPVQLWAFGIRFTGWSENPNQTALFLTGLPLIGIHYAANDRVSAW